jgi:hypothetical protein
MRYFHILPLNIIVSVGILTIIVVLHLQVGSWNTIQLTFQECHHLHSLVSMFHTHLVSRGSYFVDLLLQYSGSTSLPFFVIVLSSITHCSFKELEARSILWEHVTPAFFILNFFISLVLFVLYLEGIVPLLVYSFIPIFLLELLWFISSCILPFFF